MSPEMSVLYYCYRGIHHQVRVIQNWSFAHQQYLHLLNYSSIKKFDQTFIITGFTVGMAVSCDRLKTLSRRLRVAHKRQSHTPSSSSVAYGSQRRSSWMRRRRLRGCGSSSCGGGGGGNGSVAFTRTGVQTAGVRRRFITTHWYMVGPRQTAVGIPKERCNFEHKHARRQTQRPREITSARIDASYSNSSKNQSN